MYRHVSPPPPVLDCLRVSFLLGGCVTRNVLFRILRFDMAEPNFKNKVQQFVDAHSDSHLYDWTLYEPESIRVVCLWIFSLPTAVYDVYRRSAIILSIIIRLSNLMGPDFSIGKFVESRLETTPSLQRF